MSSEAPTFRHIARVAAIFAGLTALMTYPLVLNFASGIPSDLRDPVLNAWLLHWDADRLRHGLRGFWEAPVYYPYLHTLAHTDSLLGIAFITAPVDWLTGNPVAAHNFGFMFSYVLAGTGMYLLVLETAGRRDAALIAGLAFAFSAFRFDHAAHVQVLMFGWMPVALWALHRYFRAAPDAARSHRRRWLVLFAATFLIQTLSNLYYLYFLSIAVALVSVWELLRLNGTRIRAIAVAELAVAAVCILLVFSPVASMYYQVRQERGQVRSESTRETYSARPSSYLQVSRFMWVWGDVLPGGPAELRLFPGLTLVVLGGVAAASLARRRRTAAPEPTEGAAPLLDPRQRSLCALYMVLAAAGFIFSLGSPIRIGSWSFPGPFGWLVQVLPGMDSIRVTARVAVLFFLGLCVLGGFGAALMIARFSGAARLAVRGASPAAFGGRCISASGVAPRLNTGGIRTRRALLAERIARLGATPDLHHELLAAIVLGFAIVAEGFSGGLSVAPFAPEGLAQDRLAYEWLDGRPAGPLLELPMTGALPGRGAVMYQFAALKHGRRIVNGYLTYSGLLARFLSRPESPLNELEATDEALAALRSVGVRYIAVHRRNWIDRKEPEALAQAIAAQGSQIEDSVTFGQTTIWQLAPALPEGPRASDEDLALLNSRGFQASASDHADRLPLAFDGNARTRWETERPQSGRDEWFQIQLDRPRHIARVVLGMQFRTMGEYPRRLMVESSGGDGAFTTLYQGPVLKQFLKGMTQGGGTEPQITLDLPANETLVLRLRQIGEARKWPWAIPEIELWERRPGASHAAGSLPD